MLTNATNCRFPAQPPSYAESMNDLAAPPFLPPAHRLTGIVHPPPYTEQPWGLSEQRGKLQTIFTLRKDLLSVCQSIAIRPTPVAIGIQLPPEQESLLSQIDDLATQSQGLQNKHCCRQFGPSLYAYRADQVVMLATDAQAVMEHCLVALSKLRVASESRSLDSALGLSLHRLKRELSTMPLAAAADVEISRRGEPISPGRILPFDLYMTGLGWIVMPTFTTTTGVRMIGGALAEAQMEHLQSIVHLARPTSL